MSEFNFSEEIQINIREALEKRNLVKLHEIIEQTQLPERSKNPFITSNPARRQGNIEKGMGYCVQ
jgi:hypothetical protein